MLTEWLAPDDLGWFLRTQFQTAPVARPAAAQSALQMLDWATIDRVLRSELPLDVMTVSAGRLREVPRPRSADDARALMWAGISVVVRGAERHDVGLRSLAASFESLLPGELHVQLYATPGGTNSYGWHYDFEDVFIAQTEGIKDYYFRANTTARDTVLGDELDFTCFRGENSPIYATRLCAGDWLYIPSRWWHLVKCAEDALSISIGVMSPGELGKARRLPAGWSGSGAAR